MRRGRKQRKNNLSMVGNIRKNAQIFIICNTNISSKIKPEKRNQIQKAGEKFITDARKTTSWFSMSCKYLSVILYKE
jgi:hypothetical protein